MVNTAIQRMLLCFTVPDMNLNASFDLSTAMTSLGHMIYSGTKAYRFDGSYIF